VTVATPPVPGEGVRLCFAPPPVDLANVRAQGLTPFTVFRDKVSRVFISHSKRDAELTLNIITALSNVGATAVAMEYLPEMPEGEQEWERIRREVSLADFVMLFKTDNATSTEYTKSWIAFEIGLAAGMSKRLLVFERRGAPIMFPIPYLTDYMLFDPSRVPDVLQVQRIAKDIQEELAGQAKKAKKKSYDGLGWLFLFAPELLATLIVLGLVAATAAGVLAAVTGPIPVSCHRCRSKYTYYAGVFDPFQCPVCLAQIDLAKNLDTQTLDLLRTAKGRLDLGNGQ